METIKPLTMPESNAEALKNYSISQIAGVIRRDWKPVYFGAVPYLSAMSSLEKISDAYGYDDGRSIVAYFLANAGTWKGEMARTVKKELNRRLK